MEGNAVLLAKRRAGQSSQLNESHCDEAELALTRPQHICRVGRTEIHFGSVISGHDSFKIHPNVSLGRMRHRVRLPRPECLKRTVIRNLVQSGQEVLEIGRKRCKFVPIETRYSKLLFVCSVFDIARGLESPRIHVPRVFLCEASAYDSAEQPDS